MGNIFKRESNTRTNAVTNTRINAVANNRTSVLFNNKNEKLLFASSILSTIGIIVSSSYKRTFITGLISWGWFVSFVLLDTPNNTIKYKLKTYKTGNRREYRIIKPKRYGMTTKQSKKLRRKLYNLFIIQKALIDHNNDLLDNKKIMYNIFEFVN